MWSCRSTTKSARSWGGPCYNYCIYPLYSVRSRVKITFIDVAPARSILPGTQVQQGVYVVPEGMIVQYLVPGTVLSTVITVITCTVRCLYGMQIYEILIVFVRLSYLADMTCT